MASARRGVVEAGRSVARAGGTQPPRRRRQRAPGLAGATRLRLRPRRRHLRAGNRPRPRGLPTQLGSTGRRGVRPRLGAHDRRAPAANRERAGHHGRPGTRTADRIVALARRAADRDRPVRRPQFALATGSFRRCVNAAPPSSPPTSPMPPRRRQPPTDSPATVYVGFEATSRRSGHDPLLRRAPVRVGRWARARLRDCRRMPQAPGRHRARGARDAAARAARDPHARRSAHPGCGAAHPRSCGGTRRRTGGCAGTVGPLALGGGWRRVIVGPIARGPQHLSTGSRDLAREVDTFSTVSSPPCGSSSTARQTPMWSITTFSLVTGLASPRIHVTFNLSSMWTSRRTLSSRVAHASLISLELSRSRRSCDGRCVRDRPDRRSRSRSCPSWRPSGQPPECRGVPRAGPPVRAAPAGGGELRA